MKDIAIYGAGGFGREVACMINKINLMQGPTWNLIGFFDDGKEKSLPVSHFGNILGGIHDLNSWKKEISLVLSFGNPQTTLSVFNKITNKHINFPNIIDPSFSIGDIETFSIGIGNIIKAQCYVTCNVSIGDFNILNGFVSVGHDTVINNFNVFMPGARISGEVTIGNQNLFGTNCFIKQQLKIGNLITVSPLSALLRNPKDNNLYIGNPAQKFKF